eukprot:GHVO01041143.1.p1 GENE.GHVO01041143.1~~GHVO01041143.1.p1  ORF type:complete len:255 (+),score=43.67 GHVO01041143.1:592-1356(+)
MMFTDDNGFKRPLLEKSWCMSNYFSVGVESRIGLGFDKRRTKNQIGNKMVFANEGFKKIVFKNTAGVNMLLQEFYGTDEDGNEVLVFSTSSSSNRVLKSAKSMVAVNIPSFSSGLNLWGSTEGKTETAVDSKGANTEDAERLRYAPQKLGDGRLEFVTFGTAMALGAEQAWAGWSKRVCQGKGPFRWVFKSLPTEQRVYFQVDGEFYLMTRPDEIKISLYQQLKVLANPDSPRMGSYTFVGNNAPDTSRACLFG